MNVITTYIKQAGRTWEIKVMSAPLSETDIEFIRNFDPVIYWNDCGCYHWAFDEKLPSGRWLENMRFENALTEVRALVL